MNDNDVISEARMALDEVRMTTPVETVVARGRALRRRHRRLQALGAAIAAVGVVLGGTGIWRSSSHPQAALAAWTVSKRSDGLVEVTIRQLNDPQGLQQILRSKGVPAIVRFNGQDPPPCLEDWTGTPADYARIFPFTAHPASGVAFGISPSAVPAGAGLWIEVRPETHTSSGPLQHLSYGMRASQIYASGHCPARGGQ